MPKHTQPGLGIRLKRHPDGSASLTLTRADGTVTWQRQPKGLALVFPQHDLTHFAVEQTLGYAGAFFGLVADGWDISDFSPPYLRGEIPTEAREVEILVGLLDGIRPDCKAWNSEGFNAEIRRLATDSKFRINEPRMLTDDDLARVRAVRDDLIRQWTVTAAGDSVELTFLRN